MKKSINENYYRTSDICLATTLCCAGLTIATLEKSNPSKVIFVFVKDAVLENSIAKYYTHEIQVEPILFFNTLKEIKTRIYNN